MQDNSKKITLAKPGNMLYPVPAVMMSCGADGVRNIMTAAWAGTVCSDPPMVSVSIRKERYSHELISKGGVYCVNLVDEPLLRACDFCGCTSGRKPFRFDMNGKKLTKSGDKFDACLLTEAPGPATGVPMIAEAPVCLECRVTKILELGSHDVFLAKIEAVHAAASLMDENGSLHLEDASLTAYSHGKYHALGKILGTFGYSVKKSRS